MDALNPMRFSARMTLLLILTLPLSAFLSYVVFERLHEHHFLSASLFDAGIKEISIQNATDLEDLSQRQTELSEKLRASAVFKAASQNRGQQAGAASSVAGPELALARNGVIILSTDASQVGADLPNAYRLKKLPGDAMKYASTQDRFQIILPPAQPDSDVTLMVTLDKAVTAANGEQRARQMWESLARGFAAGFAVLAGMTLLLILLNRVANTSIEEGDSKGARRFARLARAGAGILTAASAHGALFVTAWLAIQADLTSAQGEAAYSSAEFIALVADNATIMLIALLIAVEMSVVLFAGRTPAESSPVSEVAPPVSRPAASELYKAMRPAIFLFLFGVDLSMSILPLHMERLYDVIPGLSREFALGLPVAVEFLCVGVAIFISGAWLDRKGWVPPFAVGLLLTLAGGLYSWQAPDALQFVLSRAILGFGYGLTLLAAQGFVVRHTDTRTKTQGLAHLFAGLYSGSICGAATGALIAERFGYEAVFLTGALLVFTVVAYALIYLRRGVSGPSAPKAAATGAGAHGAEISIWRFLGDRNVIAVSLLSSLPAAIAAIGFMHYFTPVYLSRIGAPEAKIGQILMLFGLCMTFLGPLVGRLADRMPSKKIPIFIGGLLGSVAFLSFIGLQGVAATSCAVVLLGLSNCFVLSSQSAYVLHLDVSKKLGEGKALGLFRASSRIGQMLGPMLFAGLVGLSDIRHGVAVLGGAYLITVILFQLLAARETPADDSGKTEEIVAPAQSKSQQSPSRQSQSAISSRSKTA
ncbi:MFS transporter [Hahella sp. KA22]|uniref:MFS transporter n=1 Tax=Hahella sp. KA22 TaxID=1628392 RepID=UPI000FDE8E0F|nr:MFS transporter [Hahella sp. KA22]AZZ92260.1 MFS transporter [Hahella sp. KA22]QAY55631.1 MFS transporter [Hahella sp. KA22]